MKKILAILSSLIFLSWGGSVSGNDFYYGDNEPIFLLTDSTKISVKLSGALPQNGGLMLLDSIERIIEVISDPQTIDGFLICSLSTGIARNNVCGTILHP